MTRTTCPARGARTAMAAALAMGAAACAHLTPDPMPRYARPRPPIDVTRETAPTRDGPDLVTTAALVAADGTPVDLMIKRRAPTDPGAPEARRPLVLILGGHQRGRDAARLVPDARGYVVAALSYPYRGPDRRLSPLALLRRAPEIREAAFATPTAIQLALDWLLAQPYVDTTRVEAVGASLGAPFMAVAAAHDARITRLWLVHAAGLHWELLEHNTRPLIRRRPVRATANRAVYTYMAGRRFSPDVWVGRVAPRPVVMINALDDERLPRRAVLALHDSARAPKRVVWLPGKHVQGNRPDVVRALVATVLAEMGDSTASANATSDVTSDPAPDPRPDPAPDPAPDPRRDEARGATSDGATSASRVVRPDARSPVGPAGTAVRGATGRRWW